MKNEPLVTRASIVSGATLLLAVLVSFGLDLTDAQRASILGFAAFLAPFVVAGITRHRVTPYSPTHVADD